MAEEIQFARFPSTAWSQIMAAQDPTNPKFNEAVKWLIEAYGNPVYSFLVSSGHEPIEAKDLSQAFFADYLGKAETKNWVWRADKEKGRFRSFLLTVLKGFVADETTRARKQKQFERTFKSLEAIAQDSNWAYQPSDNETPDEIFENQWRADILKKVRRSLERYYTDRNELVSFQIFAAYWLAERKKDQPTQEALGAQFGLSREQVNTVLRACKEKYEVFIRMELREELGSEEEVEEELRELLKKISGNGVIPNCAR